MGPLILRQRGKVLESLLVVRILDGWSILMHGRRWGRFDFKVDAEEAALRLAHDAAAKGRPTEVLVQGRFGEVARL